MQSRQAEEQEYVNHFRISVSGITHGRASLPGTALAISVTPSGIVHLVAWQWRQRGIENSVGGAPRGAACAFCTFANPPMAVPQ